MPPGSPRLTYRSFTAKKISMRGFTLIETLIYIALFALIMGGTLAITYQLVESAGRTTGNATVQDEGVFVLRKLDWALGSMASAPTIGGSGCSQTISITRTGSAAPNPIEFRLSSGKVEMRMGGTGSYDALTTDNVSATCLQFASLSGGLSGVSATTTISGKEFSTTKYRRQ